MANAGLPPLPVATATAAAAAAASGSGGSPSGMGMGRPPLPPTAASGSGSATSAAATTTTTEAPAGSDAAAGTRPSIANQKPSNRTSRRMRLNFASNSVQFDTSTIIDGFLFLGAKQVTVDREKLAAMNVKYIIGVSEDPPPDYGRDFEYMHVDVGDAPSEDISPFFEPACAFIERARNDRKAVLVHCTMGMSRSASLVLAYLVRHGNMSLAEAINYIKQRRPVVSPNVGFMAQLVRFETELRGAPSVSAERYADNRFGDVANYSLATPTPTPAGSSSAPAQQSLA